MDHPDNTMEDFLKTALSSAGICGVILWYFLWNLLPGIKEENRLMREHNERENVLLRNKMDKMIDALNIFSRVQALRISKSHDIHWEAKESAEQIISEVDSNSQSTPT